jgi:hypothetical protein
LRAGERVRQAAMARKYQPRRENTNHIHLNEGEDGEPNKGFPDDDCVEISPLDSDEFSSSVQNSRKRKRDASNARGYISEIIEIEDRQI